ncbi:Tom7p PWA37_002590 [Arxiozyma heterogenica]|uniref:Tom7p n=1 Tax=Arxiozyma heterogenica TaxID=278026 RepID=UPI002F254635
MKFLASFILSDESKERFTKIFNLTHTVAHYGWIPFILYLGWSHSSNRPNLLNLLSPLPSV